MIKKILQEIKKRIKSFCVEICDFKSDRGVVLRRGVLVFSSLLSVLVLIFTVVSDIDNRAVRVLYVGDKKLGVIHSATVYENAREDAEAYLTEKHSVAYRFPKDSAYYKLSAKEDGKYLSKTEITEYLIEDAEKLFEQGFGLYVDNTLIAIGENKEDVQAVLDETVELYSELYAKVKTADDIIVFVSKTRIEEMSVPKSIIKSKDEIRTVLGLDNMANLNEVFLTADSVPLDMTIEDISDMMPELGSITDADISLELPSENVYYIGNPNGIPDVQKNDSESDVASMTFSSSSVEVVREFLECGEEIIYDENLARGKKVLKTSGVYGIKEITYETTYLNGQVLTRTMISEDIVKEPVPKVYRVGTKRGGDQDYIYVGPGETEPGATGMFIVPTSGKLTSSFAGRDLFGRVEFHGAVDIANKSGTPVYAADGGTVILAEWFDSYGKCIIIDHGNGFKTLYAHLSSYSVKKGDIVGQGWQIGSMGMTGRVTGPHLHFEIMINDKKVDPQDYIYRND